MIAFTQIPSTVVAPPDPLAPEDDDVSPLDPLDEPDDEPPFSELESSLHESATSATASARPR